MSKTIHSGVVFMCASLSLRLATMFTILSIVERTHPYIPNQHPRPVQHKQMVRSQSAQTIPLVRYVVQMTAPYSLEGLYAYYRGTELSLHDGFCLLPEAQERGTFSIIVTPEISFEYDSDTQCVRYLKRLASLPCAWYDVTLIDDGTEYAWSMVKQDESDVPLRLPDHALIILFNPALIKGIEHPDSVIRHAVEHHHAAHTLINLPILQVCPQAKHSDIRDALEAALLARLDIQHIHKPCTEERVLAPTVTASMVSAAATAP